MLGEFAGQLDAWLLAEGVETEGELAAFRRLGVPLAQGWLLGRPAAPWVDVPTGVRSAIAAATTRSDATGTVATLVEVAKKALPSDVNAPKAAA